MEKRNILNDEFIERSIVRLLSLLYFKGNAIREKYEKAYCIRKLMDERSSFDERTFDTNTFISTHTINYTGSFIQKVHHNL